MDSLIINTPFKALTLLPNHGTSSLKYHYFSLLRFTKSRKFKTPSIDVSYSNPRNPSSKQRDANSPFKPFSIIGRILRNVKVLAVNASRSPLPPDEFSGSLMQHGAFGMALLSVTTTAKVKISPFVATLAANPTFASGLFAWFIAQFMKVFLNFCVERKWDFSFMFACGGMPSSHSALCTALTTSVAICHGVADSLFPVCLGFSLIVMYDAIGVRRHAGMHAEVLNVIVEDLFQGHPISQRKLKELLGHTPSQVLAGALLGIMVAWFCCQGCLIAS